MADLVESRRGLVEFSARGERAKHRAVARPARALTATTRSAPHRASSRSSPLALVRRLRVRLRLPLGAAAGRRAANLPVRHLAFERADRPVGGDRRRICFAFQWAIVLRELAKITHSDTAKNIARLIVPLIGLAECCSWYAVISTNFLATLANSVDHVCADRDCACPAHLEFPRARPIRHCRGGGRRCRLRPVHVRRRCADVFRALAGAARRRHSLSRAVLRTARPRHPLGRHSRRSHAGTTRSRGCRSISASQYGRACCSAASAWCGISCRAIASAARSCERSGGRSPSRCVRPDESLRRAITIR